MLGSPPAGGAAHAADRMAAAKERVAARLRESDAARRAGGASYRAGRDAAGETSSSLHLQQQQQQQRLGIAAASQKQRRPAVVSAATPHRALPRSLGVASSLPRIATARRDGREQASNLARSETSRGAPSSSEDGLGRDSRHSATAGGEATQAPQQLSTGMWSGGGGGSGDDEAPLYDEGAAAAAARLRLATRLGVSRVPEPLTTPTTPYRWFSPEWALVPDGLGESRQLRLVAEALTADACAPPAFRALLRETVLQTERAWRRYAAFHRRGGEWLGSAVEGVASCLRLRSSDAGAEEDDGVDRDHARLHPAAAALLSTLARTVVREWWLRAAAAATAAAEGVTSSNAVASSSSVAVSGEGGASSVGAPAAEPGTLHHADTAVVAVGAGTGVNVETSNNHYSLATTLEPHPLTGPAPAQLAGGSITAAVLATVVAQWEGRELLEDPLLLRHVARGLVPVLDPRAPMADPVGPVRYGVAWVPAVEESSGGFLRLLNSGGGDCEYPSHQALSLLGAQAQKGSGRGGVGLLGDHTRYASSASAGYSSASYGRYSSSGGGGSAPFSAYLQQRQEGQHRITIGASAPPGAQGPQPPAAQGAGAYLPMGLLRPWDRYAPGGPTSLVRISRPLTPGSGALADGGGRPPSVLWVRMGAVRFSEHPLMCLEDRCAVALQSAYSAYEAAMRGGAGRVGHWDTRLAALLAFTVEQQQPPSELQPLDGSNGRRGEPDRGADGGRIVFEFESDNLESLLERTAGALLALFNRWCLVLECAQVVGALVGAWRRVQAARTAAGFSSSALQLELTDCSSGGGADCRDGDSTAGGAPGEAAGAVPALYPAIAAVEALLSHLRRTLTVTTPAASAGVAAPSLAPSVLSCPTVRVRAIRGGGGGSDDPVSGGDDTRGPHTHTATAAEVATGPRGSSIEAAAGEYLLTLGSALLGEIRTREAGVGRGFGCGGLGTGVSLKEALDAGVRPVSVGGSSANGPATPSDAVAVSIMGTVSSSALSPAGVSGAIGAGEKQPADGATLASAAAAAASKAAAPAAAPPSPYPHAHELIFSLRRAVDGVTPTSRCPPLEQRRRCRVDSQWIVGTLCANGSVVAVSPPAQLWSPDFSATLNFNLALAVYRRPSDLCLTLGSAGSVLWRALGPTPLAAPIHVPVPGETLADDAARRRLDAGVALAALLPVMGELEFGAEGLRGSSSVGGGKGGGLHPTVPVLSPGVAATPLTTAPPSGAPATGSPPPLQGGLAPEGVAVPIAPSAQPMPPGPSTPPVKAGRQQPARFLTRGSVTVTTGWGHPDLFLGQGPSTPSGVTSGDGSSTAAGMGSPYPALPGGSPAGAPSSASPLLRSLHQHQQQQRQKLQSPSAALAPGAHRAIAAASGSSTLGTIPPPGAGPPDRPTAPRSSASLSGSPVRRTPLSPGDAAAAVLADVRRRLRQRVSHGPGAPSPSSPHRHGSARRSLSSSSTQGPLGAEAGGAPGSPRSRFAPLQSGAQQHWHSGAGSHHLRSASTAAAVVGFSSASSSAQGAHGGYGGGYYPSAASAPPAILPRLLDIVALSSSSAVGSSPTTTVTAAGSASPSDPLPSGSPSSAGGTGAAPASPTAAPAQWVQALLALQVPLSSLAGPKVHYGGGGAAGRNPLLPARRFRLGAVDAPPTVPLSSLCSNGSSGGVLSGASGGHGAAGEEVRGLDCAPRLRLTGGGREGGLLLELAPREDGEWGGGADGLEAWGRGATPTARSTSRGAGGGATTRRRSSLSLAPMEQGGVTDRSNAGRVMRTGGPVGGIAPPLPPPPGSRRLRLLRLRAERPEAFLRSQPPASAAPGSYFLAVTEGDSARASTSISAASVPLRDDDIIADPFLSDITASAPLPSLAVALGGAAAAIAADASAPGGAPGRPGRTAVGPPAPAAAAASAPLVLGQTDSAWALLRLVQRGVEAHGSVGALLLHQQQQCGAEEDWGGGAGDEQASSYFPRAEPVEPPLGLGEGASVGGVLAHRQRYRVRAFLHRVLPSPDLRGRTGGPSAPVPAAAWGAGPRDPSSSSNSSAQQQRQRLAGIVREYTLRPYTGLWGAVLDLRAFLAPMRRLRPPAIDYQPHGSTAPVQSDGPPAPYRMDPSGPAPYRLNIQLVRARNLPQRRVRRDAGLPRRPSTSLGGGVHPDPSYRYPYYGTPGGPGLGSPMAGGTGLGAGASLLLPPLQQPAAAPEFEPISAVVEARVQGVRIRSSPAQGGGATAPRWNAVLALPLTLPSGAPGEWGSDDLDLSLFDEVVSEHWEDDRDELTSTLRRHRRFLGRLRIPLSALCAAGPGALSGEFLLDAPEVLLGYSYANGGPEAPGSWGSGALEGMGTVGRVVQHHPRVPSVSLRISIDPPLPARWSAGARGGACSAALLPTVPPTSTTAASTAAAPPSESGSGSSGLLVVPDRRGGLGLGLKWPWSGGGDGAASRAPADSSAAPRSGAQAPPPPSLASDSAVASAGLAAGAAAAPPAAPTPPALGSPVPSGQQVPVGGREPFPLLRHAAEWQSKHATPAPGSSVGRFVGGALRGGSGGALFSGAVAATWGLGAAAAATASSLVSGTWGTGAWAGSSGSSGGGGEVGLSGRSSSAPASQHVRALVRTVGGDTVLLTRFLCPQLPPPDALAAAVEGAVDGEGGGYPSNHARTDSGGAGGGGGGLAGAGGAGAAGDLGADGSTPLPGSPTVSSLRLPPLPIPRGSSVGRGGGRGGRRLSTASSVGGAVAMGAAADRLSGSPQAIAQEPPLVDPTAPRMMAVEALLRYVSLLPPLREVLLSSAAAASDVGTTGEWGAGGAGAPADPGAAPRIPLSSSTPESRAAASALRAWCSVAANGTVAFSQECVSMGAADDMERALLLTNFLLWADANTTSGGSGPQQQQATGSSGNGDPPTAAPSTGAATPTQPTTTGPSWRTFLCLGRTADGADAAWVLRACGEAVPPILVLLDPGAGRMFHAADDACPLRSIGMLASPGNLWANAQPVCEPWRVSWDLGDARAWAPLFFPQVQPSRPQASPQLPVHPGFAALPPLQPLHPLLQYTAPNVAAARGLELELTVALSAALRSWRPRYVTRLRGDLASPLRALLLDLEARTLGETALLLSSEGPVRVPRLAQGHAEGAGGALLRAPPPLDVGAPVAPPSQGHAGVLERLSSRYTALGFPLRCGAFTGVTAVVARVRATAVHAVEDEGVQYGIGTAVVPYPGGLFAVWVYVVALVPLGAQAGQAVFAGPGSDSANN